MKWYCGTCLVFFKGRLSRWQTDYINFLSFPSNSDLLIEVSLSTVSDSIHIVRTMSIMFSKNVLVLEVILFPVRWIFKPTTHPPLKLPSKVFPQKPAPDKPRLYKTESHSPYTILYRGRGLENLAVSHRWLNTDSWFCYFLPGLQAMLTGY